MLSIIKLFMKKSENNTIQAEIFNMFLNIFSAINGKANNDILESDSSYVSFADINKIHTFVNINIRNNI